ncbi:hypothetical protein PP7435_CHR2-0058 [Komagataella phaffii CBS 7435]|uniref:Regulator of free ubiquitin chains 1 n=2 Tax=Komagataella phaffii TaxID=460519 RepID=C4R303_KOMPG|nr:Hypothetical protein PAS_chr2-2_0056 [Komagataella phaffii GS115]AOA63002.1 GQ67_01295T0 [Komagataella phaffii]CAH2447564.1 hypothetical protein BQ9382_C2-0295 [Komagataella phaffii CBS 7435]AOA67112.1 GQ68_00095T0 [Komagataella phaffii GS115]CAY69877.1 Hypothetical protein PAS_chr2-2_0056 [Komagataella phaffii GS115]CCA37755.1 hypothetical protein PP7435_CHR2-0058 [Komagataella phaffii CBS 7435]
MKSSKELYKEALNYEYSSAVSFKAWVRSAQIILRHARQFAEQRYISECYKLSVRFVDLIVNKMATHKELKQLKKINAPVYLTYLDLATKKVPDVIKECEALKTILDDEYQSYLKLQQLKRQKQKDQLIHHQNQAQTHKLRRSSSILKDHINAVDERALLKQLQQLTYHDREFATAITEMPNYPEIPQLSISTNQNTRSEAPPLPPRVSQEQSLAPVSLDSSQADLQHKTVNFTEAGQPLRTVFISDRLQSEFLRLAEPNTIQKLETCGILCGKLVRNAFFITHLVIPDQESTPNTCNTRNEEKLFDTIDQLDLFVLGWIHTHPTQSCFLSSIDLHTQNSYQIMLSEAIAIVCAPAPQFSHHSFGCFRLTHPPGIPTITQCTRTGFHPHEEPNLYVTCNRKNMGDVQGGHVVIKNHLPFEKLDLR